MNDEDMMDDSSDQIYYNLYKKQKFCAILRPFITIPIKSISLVNFINNFYNNQGFS